jgi:hypothetical protein
VSHCVAQTGFESAILLPHPHGINKPVYTPALSLEIDFIFYFNLIFLSFFFFFFVRVGFELKASCLIYPDWPQTVIFPISAFQEARITGMSHHYLA